MQNIKPMKRKLARRYQIYGVLVAAKSQRPIDILYCIDGSGYNDWKIANGFLIDGSRIFHQITNDDRQRDDGPNNRSRSCRSRLAGIISHTMKPSWGAYVADIRAMMHRRRYISCIQRHWPVEVSFIIG